MKRTLRVFLSCQQSSQRHPVPAYSFWAEYFRGALAEAGHQIIEAPDCDWAEGLLPADRPEHGEWKGRTWERALDFIRREHLQRPIDLFLGYLFPAQVDRAALRTVRSLGIPCVNFFCDNVREFRRVPAAFHGFDLHWVPEYKALSLYRTAGLPFLHAPMACWVPPRFRSPVHEENGPPTFVGTRDATREQLFSEAIGLGLKVVLQGPGWQSPITSPADVPKRASDTATLINRQLRFIGQHGWPAFLRKQLSGHNNMPHSQFDFSSFGAEPVFGDSYWHALRDCSVCLGVNRYPSWRFPAAKPDTYSRLRDIEAPMAGACYLTEWTEGIDQLYDIGLDIETYRSASELTEKVRELTGNAARRSCLRNASQRRALNEHSIARTIERIASRLT